MLQDHLLGLTILARQALNSLVYWNSQDACNLFVFELLSPLDDVQDMLKVCIELLQSVSRTENGWQMLSRVVIPTISVHLLTFLLCKADQ